MSSELESLIQGIEDETHGTKKEKLGVLIAAALRTLDEKTDRIIRQRDTGRID